MERGFTLIEIMIAVAIIGILASIAYPGYTAYTIRARRIEGQLALLENMQRQERYHSQHNTYVAFDADAVGPGAAFFKWHSGAAAAHSAYELRGQACPGQPIALCIELQALPGTARVDASFRDSECATLTLDSVGRQGATGTLARCWP
jgi:type IV pilus assembly protein PilE